MDHMETPRSSVKAPSEDGGESKRSSMIGTKRGLTAAEEDPEHNLDVGVNITYENA